MTKANTRKTIEIDRKRIPMKKLLHGKEIREAAKALEDFRLGLNEQEFLYGAKIYIQVGEYGETHAVARRLETDKEFEDRLEKARLAAEAKKAREIKRKQQEEAKRQRDAEMKRERAAQWIRETAKANGLTDKDLLDIMNS